MELSAMQALNYNVAIPVIDPRINCEAWRRLARAIVQRAIRDAQGLNLPVELSEAHRAELVEEAKDWLTSAYAWELCDLGKMDFYLIRRWARAGFPSLPTGKNTRIL